MPGFLGTVRELRRRTGTLLLGAPYRLKRIISVIHRIIGAPDYDAYLHHQAEHHPDCVPMSRDEFTQSRLVDRYSRPGNRCC